MGDFISQEEIDALLNGGVAEKVDGNILTMQEKSAMEEIASIGIEAYVSTLSLVLDKKMEASKPIISEVTISNLCEEYAGKLVAIRVDYTNGLKGSNFIILPEDDVKKITDVMMGGDGTNVSDEISALHLSAIGEAMNQMIGASSNAVSQLIKTGIDILPPKATVFSFKESTEILKEFAGGTEDLVKVSFNLGAESLFQTEVIQLLPLGYCRDTTKLLAGAGKSDEQKQTSQLAQSQQQSQTSKPVQPQQTINQQIPGVMEPMNAPPQSPMGAPYYPEQQQYPMPPEGYYQQQQGGYPPQQGGYVQQQGGYPPQQVGYGQQQGGYPQWQAQGGGGNQGGGQPQNSRQPTNVQPANFQAFDDSKVVFERKNVDIIMDVPLQVTVELGRTNRLIKDILEFATGTIIELDKLAGEPVDILVNGKSVAKGEVVVIDESFGVRITEIVHPSMRI